MSALNLEKSELDTLHARIGDVLKDADLSLISAKKTRAALAALPPGSLPASLDLVEQKKSIDVEIRKCFDAVTNGGKAAKPKKAARTPKPKAEPKPKKAPAEAKPKKTTRKHAAADTDDEPKRKRASSANSPLHRPMALSPAMAEMPRYEVVKQLWVYIKANNLQNETNKRQKLASLFGKDTVEYVAPTDQFLIGAHLQKIEAPAAEAPAAA